MEEKFYIILVGESIHCFSRYDEPHSMNEWVILINQKLGQMSQSMKVVEWFGSNGNFVLFTTKSNLREATELFQSSTGHKTVAITLSETYWLINEIRSIQAQRLEDNILLRKGIGFQLQGTKRYFEDFQVEWGLIRCIKPGVVGIMVPSLQSTFTQKRRSLPPWQKIKRKLSNKLDGEWTARSLPTLEGVFQRALLYFDQK